MKKITSYIPHQIWNERGSNIALFIEIFLVSIIVWYLVDVTANILLVYYEPTNYSTDRCYRVSYEELPESSPFWTKEGQEIPVSDMRQHFIDELSNLPEVEEVAVSDQLHDGVYRNTIILKASGDSIKETPIFVASCSVNTPRFFQYQSADGKTTEELMAVLERGEAIVTERVAELLGRDRVMGPHRLAAPFEKDIDSVDIVIGAVIKTPKNDRWSDHDGARKPARMWTHTPVHDAQHLINSRSFHCDFAVKAKPGQEQALEETLRKRMENCGMNYANNYLDNLRSYESIEHEESTPNRSFLRYVTLGLLFLLMNVFLGLLGAFWLRTQQRQAEIGLQKAIGAKSSTLVWRLIAEAMLIMTAAFLLAVPAAYAILTNELTMDYHGEYFTLSRLLRGEVLSYLLMTAIIMLGIAFPAWRAAKTNPTDVLHDE